MKPLPKLGLKPGRKQSEMEVGLCLDRRPGPTNTGFEK
jgi:hypothetical protein